jgi:hypothetical protein
MVKEALEFERDEQGTVILPPKLKVFNTCVNVFTKKAADH